MGLRRGKEYIESLRDGRRVWQGGRRIDDVPSHPGFSGAANTLAGLFDLQHVPENAAVMGTVWEGETVSYGYHPPRTMEDLRAKRRNIEFWGEKTFGVMGRLPEFCAELVTGMLDAAAVIGEKEPKFGQNARDYHKHCATKDLCLTHALTDQFYDRSKRIKDQKDPDVMLHVVRETSEGPVVRGLRNLATLSPLSDECIVYSIPPRQPDEADYALAFAIPMNAPGLSIICRDLYAQHADRDRLPLSARFDEVDATLLFEDVTVPWERVFVYRDPQILMRFHGMISMWAAYSNLVRLLVKMELFVGVCDLLTQWSGAAKDRTTQVRIGELASDVEVMRACLAASEATAFKTPSGHLAPRMNPGFRVQSIEASDRAEKLMQQVLTSSLVLTGGASDLDSPEIGPSIDRYFRNQSPSTRDHLRLLAVASDLVQSAFAGRNILYERLQSGEPDMIRQRAYGLDRSATHAKILRFLREDW